LQEKEKRINFAAAFRENGSKAKLRRGYRDKETRKNFEKDLEGEIKRYNFAVPKEKKVAKV